jgi:hypothetical protein
MMILINTYVGWFIDYVKKICSFTDVIHTVSLIIGSFMIFL